MFHRNVLLLFGVFIIAHFFALVNMASYQKYAFAFYAKGRNCVMLLNYPFTNAKKCDILNNGGSSDRCLIRLFYFLTKALSSVILILGPLKGGAELNTGDLLLLSITFPYVICFLLTLNGLRLRGFEESIRDFYWPLRDKFPREYVEQDKIIKTVRKWMALKTSGTIHWMVCVMHYLHILMTIFPIFTLIVFCIIPIEQAIVYFLMLLPFGMIAILREVYIWQQYARCKKIKKTDPKYAKHDIDTSIRW